MLAFICYFFPAIVSVWIFESLTKKPLGIKRCVFHFCANTLFINFLCIGIKRFILNSAGTLIYEGADMLPTVAFNYIVMAMLSGAILVVFEVLLFKKVKITVEEDQHEEQT